MGFVSIPEDVVDDVVSFVDSVEVSIGGFFETCRSCTPPPKAGNLIVFGFTGFSGFSGLGGVGGEATGWDFGSSSSLT
jgi:hypothetical protein